MTIKKIDDAKQVVRKMLDGVLCVVEDNLQLNLSRKQRTDVWERV